MPDPDCWLEPETCCEPLPPAACWLAPVVPPLGDDVWIGPLDALGPTCCAPALPGEPVPPLVLPCIEPVVPRSGDSIRADIVGPVCETSDTLGTDRVLPPVEVGDVLAIRDTGAYGAIMASNYNRRPTAVEVLVDAGQWSIIRRRQSVDDMLQWDA